MPGDEYKLLSSSLCCSFHAHVTSPFLGPKHFVGIVLKRPHSVLVPYSEQLSFILVNFNKQRC